jgi:DNA-binding SARP family transcriptional activator
VPTKSEPPRRAMAGNQTDWDAACRSLEAGDYEQVADILLEARLAWERTDEATDAQLLAAACRICLACSQIHAEVAWHHRAHREADARERELRQQLFAIIELIGQGDIAARPTPERQSVRFPATGTAVSGSQPIEPGGQPTVWQRVLARLGRHKPSSGERTAQRASETEMEVVPPGSADLVAVQPARLIPGGEAQPVPLPDSQGEMPAVPRPRTPVDMDGSRPSLLVYCLGPFQLRQNGELITDWDSLKGRSIFKYLVAQRQSQATRDILMDLLWPDSDPDSARRNLHQAIYSLRQTLRRGQPDFQHVLFSDGCYLLNPAMELWVDFDQFEAHVRRGRRLEADGQLATAMAEYGVAEGLYQGDFMEDELYEDWPCAQREQIKSTYLDIVFRMSDQYYRRGEFGAAIAFCQKILARDNCSEPAHRHLMRCYLAQSQRHLAVRQYHLCVQTLSTELDLPPSDETVALYQEITAT